MLGVNTELLILFIVLTATLVLFVWNRWRYDIVALVALLVVAVAGLVPPDQVFAGFGHPAVITVAAVLVLSRGLLNAGVVDSLARQLTRVGNHPMLQVATLTGIVALCSGFMNNVGALALLMPVAIWMSRRGGRSPSFLLMPLAFGSLFGGTLTLIGTPPNIIIAAYREQSGALPFGMFDFIPVGAAITMCGLFFISIIGWRLTPQRKEQDSAEDLFEISSYLTELLVPEGCKFAGRTLYDLIAAVRNDADAVVIGLVRIGQRQQMPSTYEVIKESDILQVEADSDSLKTLIDVTGLKLAEAGGNADKGKACEGELNLVEATVTPGSMLAGRTATSLDLRERYGVNVLAVARQGRRLRERLGKIRFVTGDILLIQGREESLPSALNDLGCLPLASRGLRIGKPRNVLLAICIFAVTLALIACKLLPAATALAGGAAVMVLAGFISPSEIYKSIDMSVILLLAAMLPIGQALESTGGSRLIAYKLLAVGRSTSPTMTLVILMTATMLLSNLVNNAAAAILAAPIAVNLAKGMELSSDPFLMAVAIGSSCAFLTSIGHQSNTLVMAPGGYKFGDYWRMGLPLSVMVVATAVPVILWIWPL
ncbi:MAG: SLC13 family permease [Candidatus Kuenenia sp.]|nr:SLC13 family permease [Candidatus Kuenenia sp.]